MTVGCAYSQRKRREARFTLASAACNRPSRTSCISWYCGCSSRQRLKWRRAPGGNGQAGRVGHLRQGQLSFQGRHQPWLRVSASSPARAGGLVYTGIPARRAEGRRRAGKHPAVMTLALAALLATGTSGKLGVDGLHVRHDRHMRGGAGGDQAEAGAWLGAW